MMKRLNCRAAVCLLLVSLALILPAIGCAAAGDGTDAQQAYQALKQGDRGDAVRGLQRALVALGYLREAPDGIYGKNTHAAVQAFHAAHLDGEAEHATQQMQGTLYEKLLDIDMDGTVHIAPHSGKRYHTDLACMGLSSARSTEPMRLDDALGRGLTPCAWCHELP